MKKIILLLMLFGFGQAIGQSKYSTSELMGAGYYQLALNQILESKSSSPGLMKQAAISAARVNNVKLSFVYFSKIRNQWNKFNEAEFVDLVDVLLQNGELNLANSVLKNTKYQSHQIKTLKAKANFIANQKLVVNHKLKVKPVNMMESSVYHGVTYRDYMIYYSKKLLDVDYDVSNYNDLILAGNIPSKIKELVSGNYINISFPIYDVMNNCFYFSANKKNKVFAEGTVKNNNLGAFFIDGRKKPLQVRPMPFAQKEANYTHLYLNDDGDELYFASDQKGGKGGYDLYKIRKVNGKWSDPINLQNVNTKLDDGYPTIINGDLHFSSNGRPGFGGFDLYKLETGKVKILPKPLNSQYDDLHIFQKSKEEGYLVSNRDIDNGYDAVFSYHMNYVPSKRKKPKKKHSLYSLNGTNEVKPTKSTSKKATKNKKAKTYSYDELIEKDENLPKIYFDSRMYVASLKEKAKIAILAKSFLENPESYIHLYGYTDPRGSMKGNQILSQQRIDFVRNELVNTYKVPKNKVIMVPFEYVKESNYGLVDKSLDDYYAEYRRVEIVFSESASFVIPAKLDNKERIPGVVESMETKYFKEVYFDSNQYQPSGDEQKKVDVLIRYLNNNVGKYVYLCGYADPQGNLEDNMKLSRMRVDYVKQVILGSNIDPDRIITVPGGVPPNCRENAANCLKKDYWKNRRVEIFISEFKFDNWDTNEGGFKEEK